MAVLGLSGHLLSRYIVHLELKNTPGLIFEVPGPQNHVKKLIFRVFLDLFRTVFRTGLWTSLTNNPSALNKGLGSFRPLALAMNIGVDPPPKLLRRARALNI